MTQATDAKGRRFQKCKEALEDRYGADRLADMAKDPAMRRAHANSIFRNDMKLVGFAGPLHDQFGNSPATLVAGIIELLGAIATGFNSEKSDAALVGAEA